MLLLSMKRATCFALPISRFCDARAAAADVRWRGRVREWLCGVGRRLLLWCVVRWRAKCRYVEYLKSHIIPTVTTRICSSNPQNIRWGQQFFRSVFLKLKNRCDDCQPWRAYERVMTGVVCSQLLVAGLFLVSPEGRAWWGRKEIFPGALVKY